MRYSSTTAIVLAVMSIGEAVAGPTHAHLHRHALAKKDVDWDSLDWESMGIDWAAAYAAGQSSKSASAAAAATPTVAPAILEQIATTAPPVSTPTPSAAPSKTSAAAAASSSPASSGPLESLWKGLEGCANKLAAFGASSGASGSLGDFYVGNYGSPYGSNMIKVSSTSGYHYTNTFINTQKKAITVNVWNKVGPDFQPLSGSALAPKNTALTFVLAPGATQIVAFAENSQVGWAEACDTLASSGAFATSWGEANFVSTGSGYDMSAIMNPSGNNYNMAISSAEAPGCTSDMTQNYWLTATQPIGTSDGSCFIAQSTATLVTKMGGFA